MRIALSAALVVIAGCDQIYGLTGRVESDASSGDGMTADAPCTLGEFNAAEVFSINGFPRGTFDPAMSADQLELFYVVQKMNLDLRFASRMTVNDPWVVDQEIPGANSATDDDADPTITADGRSLLFVSTRDPSITPREVYEMTRELGGEWSMPVRRQGITVNAHSIDISADGKTLYVSEGDDSVDMVYRFRRPDIGMDFMSSSQVALGMSFPSINADETELYFDDTTGIKRATMFNGLFLSPVLVINGVHDADLSHDGRRLAFQTDSGIGYIERECVVPQ